MMPFSNTIHAVKVLALLLLLGSCQAQLPPEDSRLIVVYPPLAAPAAIKDEVVGNVRGYLTTPQELHIIREKAEKRNQPYADALSHVLNFATNTWQWQPPHGKVTCPSADDPPYLEHGSRLAYAQALAFHLTSDTSFALQTIDGITKLLAITSFGEPGNTSKPDRQCQLNLSWWIPNFIHAADLLEDFEPWQRNKTKEQFQDWLATVVYPTISFSAEVSMNNWGAAATHCCAAIADYCWDRLDLTLVSVNRLSATEKFTGRSPAEAYEHANQLALGRMNGTRWEGFGGSSRACDFSSLTKSMIRPDGGIPDELRRGSSGCDGTAISENGKSNMYTQTHLQQLIAHAELLLRRGDRRLYDNIQNEPLKIQYFDPKGQPKETTLPAGRGSLLKALQFVLVHSKNGEPRSLKSAGEVAFRYYRKDFVLAAIKPTRPNSSNRAMAFETLTHGFAENELPAPPPTTPPPMP
jgi:hypothetical protein